MNFLHTYAWHIGFTISIIWSVGSLLWSLRVERMIARLRAGYAQHDGAIRYLQSDEHEHTPTVYLRVAGRKRSRSGVA